MELVTVEPVEPPVPSKDIPLKEVTIDPSDVQPSNSGNNSESLTSNHGGRESSNHGGPGNNRKASTRNKAISDSDDPDHDGIIGPSKAFDKDVLHNMILPEYKREITNTIKWRSIWRKCFNSTEVLAVVLSLIGGSFAFAAAYWDLRVLAFVSGAIVYTAGSILTYSKFSKEKYSQRHKAMNVLASQLHIQPLPDVEALPGEMHAHPKVPT